MVHNMAMQEEEEVKTLVWWNINTCPIPPGYDPRQVGPRIVSALKNSKVSGPVTITAIGRLTHNPNAPDDDVLRDLSSSGVVLIHVNEVQSDLFDWMERNPPPANILLISGPTELESLAHTIYGLDSEGYTVFLAYSQRRPASDWLWKSFFSGVYKEWLWTSLLTADMDSGSAVCQQLTTRLVLPSNNCSEAGESPWFCSFCFFAAQSFEDFTTHLKSEEHRNNDPDLLKMVDLVEMVDVVKLPN
ncbi:PREDICTED: uncharacterized protein LOC104718967 [Camelina sativa]|uniref:Uncharacterized protein LOC104718967 n=1 Tax=Camelina sativa TaxID=90675 RepID=A0ABM1QHP1_CAMSA|nr:PREDICTED: uncharacterized protein LOC104718967 [Camelina sativa]